MGTRQVTDSQPKQAGCRNPSHLGSSPAGTQIPSLEAAKPWAPPTPAARSRHHSFPPDFHPGERMGSRRLQMPEARGEKRCPLEESWFLTGPAVGGTAPLHLGKEAAPARGASRRRAAGRERGLGSGAQRRRGVGSRPAARPGCLRSKRRAQLSSVARGLGRPACCPLSRLPPQK